MNPTPVDPIDECVHLSQEVELYKTLLKQRDSENAETLDAAVKIEEERNQLRRENTDLSNAVSELRSEEVIARMQLDQLREDVTLLRSELARYQQMRPRTALELSEANDKLNDELVEVKRDRDAWKKADVLARIRISELEQDNAALRAALEKSREGWANAIELGLIPDRHVTAATILRDDASVALGETK